MATQKYKRGKDGFFSKFLRKSDMPFIEYARMWRDVFKASRSENTKAMYDNIIEKHFIVLGTVRLQDIGRIHLQIVLNNASGKLRTQEQILMTFKQVLKSAVSDHLFAENVMVDIFDNVESIKYSAPENRPLTSYEKKAVFDFNFKKKGVSINKACEFTRNISALKSPKTDNGYRCAYP